MGRRPVFRGAALRRLVGLGCTLAVVSAATSGASEVHAVAESERIVSRHKPLFASPPKKTPGKASVDAPLLGNGDVGVCIGGPPEKQVFWLAKNDFWRLKNGHGQGWPAPLGKVEVDAPALQGGTYRVEQDLYAATTKSVFRKDGSTLTAVSLVPATANLLVVELSVEGKPVEIAVNLRICEGSGSQSSSGADKGVQWGERKFESGVDIPTSCACALRTIGCDGPAFTLQPGKQATLVVAFKSSFEAKDGPAEAKRMAAKADVEGLERAHRTWWRDYWARSYVRLPDPVVEKQYYVSLYGMASCSRNPEFPPGLFGTWITQDHPAWSSDYHLNYNHLAPFYGLCSSNRLEQLDPHHAPLLAFIEKGKAFAAKELNCRGVYYPVGIGPKGIDTTLNGAYDRRGDKSPGLFCGQKSNASYCLVNVANRWYYTYDKAYAEKLYPFVREVATFWEDYLKWDEAGKRYVVENDAIHENTFGDFNPLLSLAFVRMDMALAVDMSNALGVDKDRHEKWERILNNMSAYPTQEMKGKRVFRYTEKGTSWWRNNTLGIQHVYPAGQIHLDSDPKLLRVARNTVDAMRRWHDHNGSNSFFPAAVRVGFDPHVILQELHTYSVNTRPNGFELKNVHGIENWSTVPNTVNEMLCMSHADVLRPFAVWPKDKDAAFAKIRAWGAFLVTSELKGGKVQFVRIVSERGRKCTVVNPWPNAKVQLHRNGKQAETVFGARFSLETKVNEDIALRPLK